VNVSDWNLGWIVRKRAALAPDKTAFIYEDRPVTYRELNENANRIIGALQEMGLKKGDRLGILLKNCPEFMEVFFAAASLGIVIVPLNYRLVGPELEHQLNDSGTRALVFHDSVKDRVEQIISSTGIEKDKFICAASGADEDAGLPEWAVDYGELRRRFSPKEPVLPDPAALNDPISIMYTSGVTGAPKGVVSSHLQAYFKCFQNIVYFDLRSEDIYLSQMPLFHSAGLYITAMPTLCAGGALIMRQAFDAARFAMDIEEYRPTIVTAFTTMWKFVLQSKKLDGIDTSSIRHVHGGGERTPQSLLDELASRGIRMQLGFGQTENSFMLLTPKADIQRKQGSIGLPSFFTDARIVDEEGRELPDGEIGEIVAKGPTVMTGYWNMPEETEAATRGGMLHTGDLGYRDSDGFFYIVGRSKEMYRSGAENVYPPEIEKVLSQCPQIQDVAIVGVPDEKWGEVGKAYVVLKPGEELTKEDILAFLQGKVARYKFPAHVEFVDNLPLTASGKIKKIDLKRTA